MEKESWREEYERYVLSGNITKAKQIVLDNASNQKLYKFCRGTRRQLDTMMKSEFWLSNAKLFNDPFDSLSLANVRSKSQYDRYDSTERELAYKEYLDQVQSNKIAYQFQSNVFVTCFSEVEIDNLHMWSYYADEHKGFCAEYSLKQLLDKGINILPVVYVDEWEADRTIPEYNMQVALIKRTDWKQEKEWRIVEVDPSHSEKNGKPITGILPNSIYVGGRDELHINDNWALHRELEKVFKDSPKVIEYVWKNVNCLISLNEIMSACEKFEGKRIPLFSMCQAEGRIGLREREVKYVRSI